MPAQRMKKLALDHNLNELIPGLVNRHGQIRAGMALGLSAATISKWLKANGYKRVSQYVRIEEKAS